MGIDNNTIFWFDHKNGKKLATKNLIKGNRFHKDNILQKSQHEFRIWSPYTSKLAAAIINGLEILPIMKNSKVLYVAPYNDITTTHLSDIVGFDGQIVFITNLNKKSKFYNKSFTTRKNIKIIDLNNNNLDIKVDVAYVDLVNSEEIEEAICFCKTHVKNNAYQILCLQTNLIKNINPNETVIKNRKIFEANFEIIQEINLTDFFKNYSIVLGKY